MVVISGQTRQVGGATEIEILPIEIVTEEQRTIVIDIDERKRVTI